MTMEGSGVGWGDTCVPRGVGTAPGMVTWEMSPWSRFPWALFFNSRNSTQLVEGCAVSSHRQQQSETLGSNSRRPWTAFVDAAQKIALFLERHCYFTLPNLQR